MDDALRAGFARSLHDKARAVDIGAHDIRGVASPEAIVRGGMDDAIDALHCGRKRLRVENVPNGGFVAWIEIGARGGGPHQRADAIAAFAQHVRHRCAQKTACPGHQNAFAMPSLVARRHRARAPQFAEATSALRQWR